MLKKELKNNSQKKWNKMLRKSLHTAKGRLILGFSALMVIIVLNLIISKTTGVNVIENTYNYAIKAINNENTKSTNKNYTKEIKSVEIESSDYDKPGSWHVDKSAEWTDAGKAKVTFNVNSEMKALENEKDVILVMDVSSSMGGSKLEKAKEDAIGLVEALLDNPNNQVALITFHTTSEIILDFTNNKEEIIDKINSLYIAGSTNYNHALENVYEIMSNYENEENKKIVTLFLTDGYPNVETPNQIGVYELLKDKYPNMSIMGIQYEMGQEVIQEIIEVSDHQWVADQSTLNNVLLEAAIAPFFYEKFEIVDYINNDYFDVISKDDITVTAGTVELVNENGKQKVIWTIENFMTGASATMDINLVLKDKYKEIGGYYPTNEKEEITSKLPNEDPQQVQSEETPVLRNQYNVIYETNTPPGCELDSIPNDPHFVYDNVEKKQDKLECSGYTFNDWEIVDDDVTKVNDDVFVMPSHDVTVRATWTKPSIEKTMEGKTWEVKTLYQTIKEEAEKTKGQAKKYDGAINDTFVADADKDVYIYTGNQNNNVIFANFCWKIVRTTTTGGVKIIYNGEPTDGQCLATGDDTTIGKSAFNSVSNSLAYVGYMYNKVYPYTKGAAPAGSKFSSDVIYEKEQYTLTGEIQDTLDANHHYTCGVANQEKCDEVRYYYYNDYYIVLDEAMDIDVAIEEMLYAYNVNKTSSAAKTAIDKWFEEKLKDEYLDKLEDTIFCNDRDITSLGGWDPDGGILTGDTAYLKFKEATSSKDLSCKRATDQFSTKNTRAKLKYPVGLLSNPEANLIGTDASRKSGANFWLGSPNRFSNTIASERRVSSTGSMGNYEVKLSYGLRPVVSLIPETIYSEGDGTSEKPFLIY